MVKAGRKTSSCPRRQIQVEEEDNEDFQPQEDTQSPSKPQPEEGARSPGQPQLQAQASDEASPDGDENRGETPMETDAQNQEAEDCPSRSRPPAARALWKPIPQIQPQPAGQWKPIPPLETLNSPVEPGSPGEPANSGPTRNQGCQTEEQPPQSSPGGHAHSLGFCIEPGDPPLFQQPLQTSKSGIEQIIECFRSGTNELKHMLLREVDTIFECRLCRSLFRGLPNLITHKEYYCLRRMPETDGDDRQSVAIRDLLEAIYPRKDRPDHVVRLEPMETSNKAVFQYLSTEDELNRYPAHTASNRQSPVAWDLEEGGSEAPQQSQQGASEGPGTSSFQSQSFSQAQRRRETPPEEEAPEEALQAEEDGSTSGVEDVTISCCLCGKDFNSRRSIRRHCRKEHQTKLEELRKFTETRTVPTSLLSLVKGRPRTLTTPTGKSCPVCYKNFATKANVRRHFDEVHRGLRRDTITPEIATRPGQLLTLEATPPKKPANPSPTRCTTPKTTPISSKGTPPSQNKGPSAAAAPATATATAQYNLASCRCLLCKRTYSSQVMLKRHMGIVHKMYNLKNGAGVPTTTSSSAALPSSSSSGASGVRVKQEVEEESSDENDDEEEEEEEEEEEDTESSSSASASVSDRADTPPRKAPSPAAAVAPAAAAPPATKGVKVKMEEQPPPSPKSSTASSSASASSPPPQNARLAKAPKLSVGFDFKQLFCKLCKRQFSSRQNLTKHIELHTDGTDIFIKFYRCPLCRYESRRKRDVLRHVTVVHKKSSSYLAKIMPALESRAVKRSAESVLNNSGLAKKISTAVEAATSSGGAKKEVNGRSASSSSGPPSPPSPPVTRKQDQQSSSSSGATSSGAGPATTTTTSSSSSSTAPSSSKTEAAFAPSPPVTRKQERQRQRSCSPPLTRRSDKFSHLRQHDAPPSAAAESNSSEVKVTKNFSLHACDQCGRAFAKKLYLESHKRSHRNAAAAATENRRKGINTRSKSLLW